MSFTVAQFKESVGIVTLAAAAFVVPAAHAQDAKIPVIEPATTNLSAPLSTDVCVKTTPGQSGMTAWNKLSTIMGARGQMIALEANQLIPSTNARQAKFVTVSKNLTGIEGYIISAEVPFANRKEADKLCLEPANRAMATNTGIPNAINKGELGIVLKNQEAAGSKTAIAGMYPNGSLFAVHFNAGDKTGALKIANVEGNKFINSALLVDVTYSETMKKIFEVASTTPPKEDTPQGRIVAAANTSPSRAP